MSRSGCRVGMRRLRAAEDAPRDRSSEVRGGIAPAAQHCLWRLARSNCKHSLDATRPTTRRSTSRPQRETSSLRSDARARLPQTLRVLVADDVAMSARARRSKIEGVTGRACRARGRCAPRPAAAPTRPSTPCTLRPLPGPAAHHWPVRRLCSNGRRCSAAWAAGRATAAPGPPPMLAAASQCTACGLLRPWPPCSRHSR